ncbi:MAG: response regulator transcription factor [Sphaerochaetaceae bacterium]|nr:response regulator transcription factor [Sphaerochaetaceae bacterium]
MDNDIQILVVEDDGDIQELMCHHLEKEGFHTIRVSDGESALDYVRSEQVDLILLDLNLPKVSGLDVLKTIRYTYQMNTHIIIASARTDESDIITALELGADNYLPKPFSPKVLVANVKALLRRSHEHNIKKIEKQANQIEAGPLSIDLLRYEVTCGGEVISLSATEFSLLAFLASFPGRVFTRNQIISKLKGDDYPVTQRSIDVQIASLRKKLKEAGELINTVWGIGYSFQDKM